MSDQNHQNDNLPMEYIVADANADNWVYRSAPAGLRPYLKLARLDRPVGVWLLLWPCIWGLILASIASGEMFSLHYLALFAVGAIVMRGAGCTFNDIIDRDFDGQVARTALRPIPAGEVTVKQAWLFLIAQCLIGFIVLIQFNLFSIILGASSLLLVAAYPFMKRITWWPQAWLGLTFNWGALMGWSVVAGGLDWPAVVLYAGCICWTIGYDTIYAHQDREDDALIGIKSTARLMGDKTKIWLIGLYMIFAISLVISEKMAGGGNFISTGLLSGVVAGLAVQIWRLDINDPVRCLALFKGNIALGMLISLAFAAAAL